MKAIVTGGSGFVGSALIKELLKNDIEVLSIDRTSGSSRLPKDPRVKQIAMSIENIEQLETKIAKGEYDLFYHFAWRGSAGPLRMDENVQTTNALWTVKCLRTAAKLGCKKFICAGSIMEYEVQAAMYAQGSKPGMGYIYGVGKVLAHELCKPIANNLGIDLVWTYITNAYGVGERSPRFINSTLRKMNNNERLEFTAGTQNYDFIYVTDVAKAFYLLGIKGKANKGYLIGSGDAKPLKDLIIEMTSKNSPDNAPHFGDVPFTGVNVSIDTFDISPIVEDTGFKPIVSFAKGTKRTMDWLKEVDK